MSLVEPSISCPSCRAPISGSDCNTGAPFVCPGCASSMQAEVFPALFRQQGPPESGEKLTADDEASCFYHEQKRAAVICSMCGRFLCSLCEIRHSGASYCPNCIQRGREQEKIQTLVTQRTLYDGIALSLSLIPLLIFYFTIITAPIAIFVALRFWNKPTSILPRTKIRYVLAILFSLLQIAGWTFLIVAIFD